ncbi:MAG: response regulator transcription factor [Spirochaetales bacterium]|nr:response regulator transcription factor [Spirochaetales bacterium]MBR4426816.1 response regulator transcription factor [Spirochaetales bacterium]
MNGLLLFTYTTSISMACMALALSIAAHILHKTAWSGRYIVIQSCLIGMMVLFMASKLSLFFLPEGIAGIFNFIFDTVTIASMSFVIIFLPYFLSWVIAKPWRRLQTLRFYPMAFVYFGLGLAAMILKDESFDFWVSLAQTLIALGVFAYCIITLWINLKNIKDPSARHIALAINIVSLSLIPLSIFALFNDLVADFSYPIYLFAFSLIIVVYDYIRFDLDRQAIENKPELSFESLSKYKISEREFTVVQLICEGLTNKEIAQELNISVNTVNNHVANIFGKLDVRSRIDLLKVLKEGPWA